MASVIEPAPGHQHRRIRWSGLIGVFSALLFVPMLVSFLFVRLVICQGIEENLGRMTWLCPMVNLSVPLLMILVSIAFAIIVFELHSLGAPAEAKVRQHYAAMREQRAAQSRRIPLAVSIEAFRAMQELMASTGARIVEGHQRLDDTHRRHVRRSTIALVIVAAAWIILLWEWGPRGSLGLAP